MHTREKEEEVLERVQFFTNFKHDLPARRPSDAENIV